VHSCDEQGMSCRRYSSRTIFWTLPLLVDRTKILLEIFDAYGSDARDLLRLVILLIFVVVVDFDVAAGRLRKHFSQFIGAASACSSSEIQAYPGGSLSNRMPPERICEEVRIMSISSIIIIIMISISDRDSL
jgi:hypothetical protein